MWDIKNDQGNRKRSTTFREPLYCQSSLVPRKNPNLLSTDSIKTTMLRSPLTHHSVSQLPKFHKQPHFHRPFLIPKAGYISERWRSKPMPTSVHICLQLKLQKRTTVNHVMQQNVMKLALFTNFRNIILNPPLHTKQIDSFLTVLNFLYFTVIACRFQLLFSGSYNRNLIQYPLG